MLKLSIKIIIIIICAVAFLNINAKLKVDSLRMHERTGIPVILTGDTLFYINANIGPFTAQQRVEAIEKRLSEIVKKETDPNSIKVRDVSGITNIELGSIVIMSISDADTIKTGKSSFELGNQFASILRNALKKDIQIHSTKTLLINTGITVLLIIIIFFLFWGSRKIFPKGYAKFEGWEGTVFKPIKVRNEEILSAEAISAFFIVLLKLIRLAISLAVIYFFIIYSLSLFPWTRYWNVKPILSGVLLAVIVSTAGFIIYKAINTFFNVLSKKAEEWKGTLIKSVKVKNLEILSDERILETIKFGIKVGRFFFLILLTYFYITLLFSLFYFTRTWASTLFGYIINPLGDVLISFVKFLPHLFTILVIAFVTRYVIKFIKFIFGEIERETVTFVKFPPEWAEPTYKIVRFLVIVFAAIVIFPYIPGSNSSFFRGISIFLGILFSFGSTSAVSNIVGGVVLTYMRPFKIGDRVKIADTIGDVIEKTLLGTRLRTIKNVDVTVPNSMVLGSHIINYSSTAKQKGLILHTTVTITYDAPWRKIHELLIAAASATENILKEPVPFILQTALDDFYVHYELNVYTDKPNIMAKIYSDLHQNIQDKFNEAGIEIMSPHFSGMRDGNKIQIPDEYLPKNYNPPPFRISPFGNPFNNQQKKDQ
jgi:small-conductance mechanosensitive channel